MIYIQLIKLIIFFQPHFLLLILWFVNYVNGWVIIRIILSWEIANLNFCILRKIYLLSIGIHNKQICFRFLLAYFKFFNFLLDFLYCLGIVNVSLNIIFRLRSFFIFMMNRKLGIMINKYWTKATGFVS